MLNRKFDLIILKPTIENANKLSDDAFEIIGSLIAVIYIYKFVNCLFRNSIFVLVINYLLIMLPFLTIA